MFGGLSKPLSFSLAFTQAVVNALPTGKRIEFLCELYALDQKLSDYNSNIEKCKLYYMAKEMAFSPQSFALITVAIVSLAGCLYGNRKTISDILGNLKNKYCAPPEQCVKK